MNAPAPHSGPWLVHVDPDGRVVRCSESFLADTGLRAEGAEFWSLLATESDRRRARRGLGRVREARRPVSFDATLATGRQRWDVAWRCSPEPEGGGVACSARIRLQPRHEAARQGAGEHYRYLESMDRVSRVLEQASEVSELIWSVVGVVREVFEADRAWLLNPCDPEAPELFAKVEVTRPGYPGAFEREAPIPMDAKAVWVITAALGAEGPLTFGPPPNDLPMPTEWDTGERYAIRSQVMVALRPRVGQAWLLGLHQCSYARVWSALDRRLLRDISYRIEDALTNLLLGENLRDSERRYRTVVESLREPVFQADARGRLRFLNRAWEEVTGVPVGESLGTELFDYFHPDDREGLRRKFQALMSGAEESWLSEARCLPRDRPERWLAFSVRPHLEGPRRVGVIGSLSDVTERKEAERQLLLAKEAAEATSRIQSEFMDIASHELRTPLTPLLLRLQRGREQLSRGKPPSALELEKMERGALRLAEMINDLLDVSRLERGRLLLRMARLDLRRPLEEVVDDFRGQAAGRRLSLRLPEAPVLVEADLTRIEQVVANLVDNALKYSPPEAQVEARLEVDGSAARVEVEDHGPGIPEGQRARLFSRFFRIKSEKPGLGLGLYISHELIAKHGGTLDVRSEEGRGSTFYFTLPLA